MVLAKASCYHCSLYNLKFVNTSFETSMFVIFSAFCENTQTDRQTHNDYNTLLLMLHNEGNNTHITPIRMYYVF